jgi:tetratricopeptide (TPR) repeat protein
MDTKQETSSQEPFTIVSGRDTIKNELGLHLAVATMQRGERSLLRVSPHYGFGENGSFSFPTVPSNASLEYEVELIDWGEVDEDKDPGSMMFEERLEAAQRRKAEGNAAHAAGQSEQALSSYRLASSFITEDLLMQLEGFHLDQANAIRLPILLNSAACHLKLQDYPAAIAATTEALYIDPTNAKALYRRGIARHALGQTEGAMEDLKKALIHAPGDGAIKREMATVRRTMEEESRAEAKLFSGVLNNNIGEEEKEEDGEDDDASKTAPLPPPGGGWVDRAKRWWWKAG